MAALQEDEELPNLTEHVPVDDVNLAEAKDDGLSSTEIIVPSKKKKNKKKEPLPPDSALTETSVLHDRPSSVNQEARVMRDSNFLASIKMYQDREKSF